MSEETVRDTQLLDWLLKEESSGNQVVARTPQIPEVCWRDGEPASLEFLEFIVGFYEVWEWLQYLCEYERGLMVNCHIPL